MTHPHSLRFFLLALLLCLTSVAAFAQNAQLTGRVSDQTGANVPGAQITITNVATGINRASCNSR